MYLLLSKNIANINMTNKNKKPVERETVNCNYNKQLQGGKEKWKT